MADAQRILRDAFAAGRAAHGPLPLAFEVFAARALDLVRRRLGRLPAPVTDERVAEALARAALSDLHLAVACEEGIPGAWEAFDARYTPILRALAFRRGAFPGEAEALSRSLPGDLFTPPPAGGARTRLGTFDGSGSLKAWLGVIVDCRLADGRRAAARGPRQGGVPGEEGADGAPPAADPGLDPAALSADRETAAAFAAALAEGWGALTDREALALRLRYRDGLPQTAIARLLGVGEPRVSRLLGAAEERLRAAVERRLRSGPAAAGDPDRLWRLLRDVIAERMATSRGPDDPVQEETPRHG